MPSQPSSQLEPSALSDERERDEAITSDAALVRYQQKWERKLARLQRSYPERWHVPGLSDEETRDALTLRLLEVVRGERCAHAPYNAEGKEWGLSVMRQHLRSLRRSFRLGATPTDFNRVAVRERQPDQEESFLQEESASRHWLASERAHAQLSRPQRRWLAAMKMAANAGAFFEASQSLNLSAASRILQKHRSSAQRAFQELQAQFMHELDKLE